MKTFCLTIAGSDPTSGAGIQADIRTFDRCGVHPFSAITAITYQNATEFVGYKSLSDDLDNQLDSILGSYPVKYVKIGMIPDVKALDIIVENVKKYELIAVLDPVSVSSAGARISSEGLELEIERDLFPHLKILTPNVNEASFYTNSDLLNRHETDIEELKNAAKILVKKLHIEGKHPKEEKAVVIKSAGTTIDKVFDLICIGRNGEREENFDFRTYTKPKLSLKGNIHGTGCVFSSAITGFLAKGYPISIAIEKAEAFFDSRFQKFIELPNEGRIIDLTLSEQNIEVINQIKEVYNYISKSKKFSILIPEVRMNISGSLQSATTQEDIAAIEGRITLINGYPQASGEIKFGVSDHTARLILSAKEYDKSINFVTNLKYNPDWIKAIQDNTDLDLQEIIRENQPLEIKKKEFSTMQWLIKESVERSGKIPDIIWDKGAMGKEPIIRLFGKNSKNMIEKLEKIITAIEKQ
ncbi:MAG TPA: bifunctional hydroxymethylpyrimidine kinase/phosphomethylpyrimidine kinase [Candidatus Nanopelagicaceae bacterium]|nr:bifunctional hydroxymethylpyrimidine kinase/phosphomethylpyrimidine kinase [Candidatus Nanopelagicaceae bacterium]